MIQEDTAQSCHDEHRALQHIKEALSVTLSWRTPQTGLSRKLSGVVFIIRALQRHLEHQLALEERGGYVESISQANPSLTEEAQQLLSDHDVFRESLRDLVPEIEGLDPQDETRFNSLCDEVARLIRRMEEHDLREGELLQELYLRDEGGEG
ncbi:MAG: hemerythrin domain-containing protein [Planctomycetales bacterium]|nr:hemerythrin domain-containing protein [Planctomycetales bacterium]